VQFLSLNYQGGPCVCVCLICASLSHVNFLSRFIVKTSVMSPNR